jgi:manganese transport system ATP-binding protein
MPLSSTAVSATDIVVAYGDRIALDKSTFDIPASQITAVIGPNGSGKTTLLSTIAGLVDPIRGSLDVLGGEPGNPRVSYVLQTAKINEALPISVGEVVTMGRYAGRGWHGRLTKEDKERISGAMSRMDIQPIADRHVRELSGGQRQRVFVAQGLAQDHDLLLLDEPLTGIDLAAAQAIDEVIHDEIDEGCTVVMTTHDLSEARIADHVLLLNGRVVAAGSPEEVLTSENLSAAYGEALLHLGDGEVFIDDPAHKPVPGRHVHRAKSVHPESAPEEVHRD